MRREEKLEVVRGSGNVFRDLGHTNADAEQFKAILVAKITEIKEKQRPPPLFSRTLPRVRMATAPVPPPRRRVP